MKAVLDTNVLVSALLVKNGKAAQILRRLGEYQLVSAEEILAEAERVLHYQRIRKRYPLSEEDVVGYLHRLREVGRLVPLSGQLKVIREDPDDDKFVECAIVSGAAYIVSGDAHLLDLGEYQGVAILRQATFLELLTSKTERQPG